MSLNTHIQWCTATWNPIIGCSKVNSGCAYCYALTEIWRLSHNPKTKGIYDGLVTKSATGTLQWTGKTHFIEDRLTGKNSPLRTRKPQNYFVSSLGDPFHPSVSFEQLDKLHAIMGICHWHRFILLTKQYARAQEYYSQTNLHQSWLNSICSIFRHPDEQLKFLFTQNISNPLSNLILMHSYAKNSEFITNVETLRNTLVLYRGISFEPLIENIGMGIPPNIDWIIAGGESGPQSRSCQIEWFYSLLDSCRLYKIPYFNKQLGSNIHRYLFINGDAYDEKINLKSRKGGNPDEWPPDLRIRQLPDFLQLENRDKGPKL